MTTSARSATSNSWSLPTSTSCGTSTPSTTAEISASVIFRGTDQGPQRQYARRQPASRTFAYTRNQSFLELARKSIQYTAKYQRADASWYYGEGSNLHWVDNFHTGYVLDCFKRYTESTEDHRFDAALQKGYSCWKKTFFLDDGTPRYYDCKTLPLDIQCCSQAIDTLVYF